MRGGPERGIRIAVDARMLRAAGIGRYLRPIVRGMISDRRFGQVVLAGDPDEIAGEVGVESIRTGRVRVVPWRGGPYSPRAHLAWGLRVGRQVGVADVAFFPHYDVPPFPLPERVVVTVHDLTHFVLPHLFPAPKRIPAGVLLGHAVRRAERVLVGSARTRADLVERIPEVRGKIASFRYGLGGEIGQFTESGTASPVGGPYLLSVGNRKAHKNLGLAVRTLAALAGEHPQLRLVFAGGSARDGWHEVLRLAAELGVEDRIVDLGRVSDRELAALYRGCAALLILSFNEGFGYPALEAMALGAPVVAARAGALPEVLGDAGLLVDPNDPAEAAAAVRRLIEEPTFRDARAAAGRERAARFSEPEMVRRTLDVLTEAARGTVPPQPVVARKR